MSNYSVSIKGIGIENFKAFGEYQYFDLAPLTIITGPNNSGKSALIAALELLSNSNIYSSLEFHSSDLEIGDISQVVNKKSKSNFISFHFNFNLHSHVRSMLRKDWSNYIVGRKGLPVKKDPDEKSKNNYEKYIESCSGEIHLNFDKSNGKLKDILIKLKEEKILDIDLTKNICFIDYKFFETQHNFNGKLFKEEFYEKIPELNKIEKLILDSLSSPLAIGSKLFPFSNYLSTDISLRKIECMIMHITTPVKINSEGQYCRFGDIFEKFKFEERLCGIGMYNQQFVEFLDDIKVDIIEILTISKGTIKSVFKLEAQRASKQRLYLYQEKHIPLTRDIINAAETTLNSSESDDASLKKYLNKWTGKKDGFKLFDDFKFIQIPGVGYRFEVKINGEARELPDLGFGTRQVLPVILAVYNKISEKYGSHKILIIEEPESNLHPRLQSLLADLFVESTRHVGNPLIIETHSEYLIRKLQYLVAKQEVSPESIAIHYIGVDTGKGRDIFKINIDKDGSLDRSFGSGFFDEADNIAMELFILSKHQRN